MYSLRMPSYFKSSHQILEPTKTTGGLWLGDFTQAIDKKDLKKKGINTVLTVAAGLNIVCSPDVTHKVIQALDIETYDLSKHFEDCIKFIDEGLKRGSVLVHCAAGVSRSATITVAYLMKKNNWSFKTAYNYVKKKRSVIGPNPGFLRQLRAYEKKIKSTGI
jgi:protein-tyrosine phosphatase